MRAKTQVLITIFLLHFACASFAEESNATKPANQDQLTVALSRAEDSSNAHLLLLSGVSLTAGLTFAGIGVGRIAAGDGAWGTVGLAFGASLVVASGVLFSVRLQASEQVKKSDMEGSVEERELLLKRLSERAKGLRFFEGGTLLYVGLETILIPLEVNGPSWSPWIGLPFATLGAIRMFIPTSGERAYSEYHEGGLRSFLVPGDPRILPVKGGALLSIAFALR